MGENTFPLLSQANTWEGKERKEGEGGEGGEGRVGGEGKGERWRGEERKIWRIKI